MNTPNFPSPKFLRPALILGILLIGLALALFTPRKLRESPHSGRQTTSTGTLAPAISPEVLEPTPTKIATAPPAAQTGEAAKEQLRKDGQYESLSAAFQAARYAVEKIDPAGPHSRGAEYFAANPKQQLRAWFSKDGIELASGRAPRKKVAATPSSQSRGSDAPVASPIGAAGPNNQMPREEGVAATSGDEAPPPPWSLALRLRAAGRTGALSEITPSEVRSGGGRVEMTDLTAGFTQWLENRKEGVEQGFTVAAPPPSTGPLEVVMSVEGTLRTESLPASQGVRFVDSDGAEVLEYTGLKAWDATGRALPARMEVRGAELALLVTDAGAKYPVTIDPLFASAEARLVEDTDDGGNQFGNAVALSGDTALVGAHQDDTPEGSNAGSVYVFVRSGTIWSQQVKLTASDGESDDRFGTSVAFSPATFATALVGAARGDIAAGLDAGSAYVFVRSGTSWSQQAKLTAADGAASDLFGASVAVTGDIALVGAVRDDTPAGANAGSAYVFVRSGMNWSQEAKLTAADAAVDDLFGGSVALLLNTALIGAVGDDTPAGADAGSAYVFVRSGGAWRQEAKLTAADAAAGDSFGNSVALGVNSALVGAVGDDTPAGFGSGSAYVFVRSTGAWSQQAKLLAADAAGSDSFGISVALSGNTALVGAFASDTSAGAITGSAYVFARNGTSWSQQMKLTAGDAAQGDSFGNSVALSGDTALVGAFQDDTPGGDNAGSASVFVRTGSIWNQQAALTASAPAVEDSLGISVALSGDTALVGASNDDTPAGIDAGSAFVFVRRATIWSQEAKLTATDGVASDFFGNSVALSGDTALVGALLDDTPSGTDSGSAYVFVRSGVFWSQQAKLTAADAALDDRFANSVALTGNTALVGAVGDDNLAGANAGSAYVFVRSGTNWSQEAKLTAADGADSDRFGSSVALSGETALVGAFASDTPAGASVGSAYVFVRGGVVWSQQAKLTAADGAGSDSFGSSVTLSNETALVGARRANTLAGREAGSAYVFVRSGAIWTQQAKLTASNGSVEAEFGGSVALNGNLALVGAPGADTIPRAGSAYVFTRSGSIWSPQATLSAGFDSSSDDFFGGSVALSGDNALVGASGAGTGGGSYVFVLGELPQITQQPVSRTVVPGQGVTFGVTATGYAPLRYQWRKNGSEIAGASATSYSIASVTEADAGIYDVVISNIGGTATSAAATLSVNALSQFAQQFAGAPPSAQGFVLVTLSPAGISSGWRFVGEQQWRASGLPVGGLATGDREMEFRPVPGFSQPPRETVTVISGEAATFLEREYFETSDGATGGVSVLLKPDSIAGLGAQWRLLGDDDTQWRNSGTTAGGLPPGTYLIECKLVTANPPRATPTPFSVTVAEGETRLAVATYFLQPPTTGTQPSVLPFETVTTNAAMPFGFVGQLRSEASAASSFTVTEGTQVVDPAAQRGDAGSASGFVVKARVVATVAHAVFDDGNLSYVRGLQWLFQRDRGTYEPVPKIPRGAHVLAGYAAQRAFEFSPGVSQPESQNLDVAALFFYEDAGRPGVTADGQPSPSFSGYLASDAADNEFLRSSQLKILVGYPVEGVSTANEGRMHATPPANVPFTRVPGVTAADGGPFRIYTTSAISSNGGSSGGPLCVQFDDGKYYPAAIYLGGSAQTVVRAIDSRVIDLFNAAEVSGNGGNNNTGGGIIQVSSTNGGGTFQIAAVKVDFTPGAALGGARWTLGPNGAVQTNGAQLNVAPNRYAIYFTPVAGFLTPPPASVTLTGGNVLNVTRRYNGVLAQPDSRTVNAFTNAVFNVTASPGAISYQWQRNNGSSWVNIEGARNASYAINGATTSAAGNYRVRVTWSEGEGTVSDFSQPALLTVNRLTQTITFPPLPNRVLGDPPFSLNATSSAPLPVSYALVSGPAALSGATVTPTAFGTVTIRASASGNSGYGAATPVDQTFQVTADNVETWRARFFSPAELANPLISGILADRENDGLETLLEFALNLNPNASDLVTMTPLTGLRGLPFFQRELVGGQTRLTAEFVRRRAIGQPGITYRVEFSPNLQDAGAWTAATGADSVTQIDQTWERVKVSDPTANANMRFGRLVVTQP